MATITLYTTTFCPYCVLAKQLLDRKGVSYDELRVDDKPALREEMVGRSRRFTVPQIFIDDYHVGGFDDLAALDAQDRLDELLGIA